MMKSARKKYLIIVVMFMLASLQSHASNVSFLKYAVITDFTDSDIQQLIHEYKKVLKNNKPGESQQWESTETKNGGKIKVIKQYKKNNNSCKRLMFKTHSEKQSATSYFNFCLINQLWQLSG